MQNRVPPRGRFGLGRPPRLDRLTLSLLAALLALALAASGSAARNRPPSDGGSTGQPANCSAGQFKAEYFTTKTLSGTPAVSRCENAIDYGWNGGSPDPAVPANNFSARWLGDFDFAAGNTTFTLTVNDGVRLWVDGAVLLDKWFDQSASYTVPTTLAAGTHQVKVCLLYTSPSPRDS